MSWPAPDSCHATIFSTSDHSSEQCAAKEPLPDRDTDTQWAPPRAIVSVEANSGKPSKGDAEAMARRRFQDPTPIKKGNWWYLLYWQDEFASGARKRKRVRKQLALAAMPQREVKKLRDQELSAAC